MKNGIYGVLLFCGGYILGGALCTSVIMYTMASRVSRSVKK